jgi:asparagine N-glycosylation enzyme membrane subunit Stt3
VDRIYTYNPYHLILAAAGYIIGIELATKIIPLIFGLLSMTLFYMIMENLRLKEKKRFFICLILALSPIFIYTFSTSSQFAIILFLNLLGFYFFIKKQKIFTYLSILVFASIPFFNFFNALVTLILLFTYTIVKGVNRNKFYFVSAGIILKTLIYHLYIFYRFGLPQTPSFISHNIIQNLVSDLGAKTGFSFFAILLAAVGLVTTWKKRREFYYIYVLALVLIISSIYFQDLANIYLNFVIVIMAGYGLFFLIDRKWDTKIVKNASLLLIICGIVFSMVSFMIRFSSMPPYSEEIESLEWLNQNSNENDRVLSYYSNGFWIEYFAKRPVLLDSYFDYINDLEQKYADSEVMLHSRSLKITKELLDKNNIRYVWINKAMKQGLVWSREDEGLLFLFKDKETFKKIYTNDEAEIWEYLKG